MNFPYSYAHSCAVDDSGVTCWGQPTSFLEIFNKTSAIEAGTAQTVSAGQITIPAEFVFDSILSVPGLGALGLVGLIGGLLALALVGGFRHLRSISHRRSG